MDDLFRQGVSGAAAFLILTAVALLVKATGILSDSARNLSRLGDGIDRFADTVDTLRGEIADLRAEVREIAGCQAQMEKFLNTAIVTTQSVKQRNDRAPAAPA